MSDRLGTLLEQTADDWCRDAQPPPLPLPARSAAPRRPRRLTHVWAPVFAAAAVVAVAVPVVLLSQRQAAKEPPIQQVGDAVAVDASATTRFLPTDAGLPDAVGFGPNPTLPPCTSQQITVVLDLAGDQLRIQPRRATACDLPNDLRVVVPGSVRVVRDTQPAVPNPPAFNGEFLDAGGVALNIHWTGACDTIPSSAQLVGSGLTMPLDVQGRPNSCGTGEPVLQVGPAHRASGPGAVVPADRADLRLSLDVPTEISSGSEFHYQVNVTNPTDHRISLRPCPTFATMYRSNGGGGGGYGRMPCEKLPDHLNAREQIALVMTERTENVQPAKTDSRSSAQLTWQIAGTEKATGITEVVDRAPHLIATVPYLAPDGSPTAKSTYRYPTGGGAFPVIIQGPATAHAGDILRYKVVFTNPAGGPTVPLRPCPAWTELIAQAPKVTNRPKIIERSGAIDCSHAPDHVAPGEQIVFEMERTIGTDTPPGAYQLYWQIHNGMTSAPFDLNIVD